MMINVTGSLSAINNVGKSLKELNAENIDLLDLTVTSDLKDITSTPNHDGLEVHMVNLELTSDLYQNLNDLSESYALTFIDNGNSEKLKDLLKNQQLTTRVLGLQSHCCNGNFYVDTERVFRLRQLRENPDISEIVLRTSDIAVFNMNAIRRSDQCGCLKSNTTGLTIEEACQIAKFIGASDLIQTVYIAGLNLNNDVHNMMSTNVANLLWYMTEGMKMRNMDENISDPENLVFSVVADPIERELQFVKSTDSGRWWVKVPTEEGHMHMACSKKDYEMACNNEISDRISRALDTVI